MIPLFYFPSTAVLLDDELYFVNILSLALDKKIATYKTFSSPIDTLKHLNKLTDYLTPERFCLPKKDSLKGDTNSTELDYSKIKQIALEKNRFNQVSTVIADFNMPMMNGLEFFQRIPLRNVKKILLTGEVDETIAEDAVNKGIIDRYLKKHDFELTDKISSAISECQLEYFRDCSLRLLPSAKEKSIREDPNFEKRFFDVIKKNKIVEYYLLDSRGQYLLIDQSGTQKVFDPNSEDLTHFTS